MTDQTQLPGKDSPLEHTLEKAKNTLSTLGIEVQETSYLNPVPHCWSVHLQETSCSALYTNGKGTSKLASMASGIGEFIERLATDFFFSEYYITSGVHSKKQYPFIFFPDEQWFSFSDETSSPDKDLENEIGSTLLSPELLNFYNPDGELTCADLTDNNCDDSNKGICALPFIQVTEGSVCYFPISLLNNLYVSNGMAAGNSPSECKSQALSEIIERYVKNIVIAKGLSLPIVPDASLAAFPHLLTIRDTLIDNGFSVTIHDSSLGGQFPVICVLLVDTENGGAYAAFGANCRFETAVERTLTELLQGRELNQLHNFSFPVHNIAMVADQYNLESHFIDSDGLLAWSMFKDAADFSFSPWSFNGSTAEEEKELHKRISSCGHSIYLREYLHCGLYSCRIIVPGMSEIYPVDDLIWNNRNKGSKLRPQILNLPTMSSSQLAGMIELLDELELDDQLLLSHVIGILFDQDSNWKTLRIGELKAHIYLAMNDYDSAIEWCDWAVLYGDVSKDRANIFRAVSTLLQFTQGSKNMDDYSNGVLRCIPEADLQIAKDVIGGQEMFLGLNFCPSWEEISSEHQKLTQLYDNLRSSKSKFSGNIE